MQRLKMWTRPESYGGAEWPDYYVFLGKTRDSDCLTLSNYECASKMLRPQGVPDAAGDWGSAGREEQPDTVITIREGHWAVGWVEWIAIHKSDTAALTMADSILEKLDGYPVLNEEDFSEREQEEANSIWTDCYTVENRIEYVREHRDQFNFRDFSDMLSCIRGDYFAGYASELLN